LQSNEAKDEKSTPTTLRSGRALLRFADKIEKKDMSLSTRRLIAPLPKGTMAIATSEGLAYEKLAIKTDTQKE
jgi:hypothetical protein